MYSRFAETAGAVRLVPKALLVSIHSLYAKLILSGEKRIELRRRFAPDAAGARMLIYETMPTAAVVGHVMIDRVDLLSTDEIWLRYGKEARISAGDFQHYFAGIDAGYAILLNKPTAYKVSVPLKELRNLYGLSAPQSYVFLREAHRELIEHEQD